MRMDKLKKDGTEGKDTLMKFSTATLAGHRGFSHFRENESDAWLYFNNRIKSMYKKRKEIINCAIDRSQPARQGRSFHSRLTF